MARKILSDRELESRFNDFLDECYGQIEICGYDYAASDALKSVDPTAYRCGLNDWVDAELSDGQLIEVDVGYALPSDDYDDEHDDE